jgi:uncharacterized membrane-anchored protein
MRRLLLLLLLVVVVAVLLGVSKASDRPGHRSAGWTWDDSQSAYSWVDPTPDRYALDDSPS